MTLSIRIPNYLLNLPIRIHGKLHCHRQFQYCLADGAKFTPQTKIYNSGSRDKIIIGINSLMMGELLTEHPESKITIGDWCYIGPDAKIWAMDHISIGHRVFISHGVSIFDNNSHSMSAIERHWRFREKTNQGKHLQRENVKQKPVCIKNDVWIGFNAAILKGVTIGTGSIIGAHTVITHDVPDYSIMVGNPARKTGDSLP